MKNIKREVIVMILVFMVTALLSGTVLADLPKPCTSYSWAPSSWNSLSISRSSTEATTSQWFMWDTAHMNAFKALNSYYQYEVRRFSEVWDWWRSGSLYCYGYYWTNLPNPTGMWSEENDPPLYCIDKSGDEEFEIKSKDPSAMKANYWYGVSGYFLRDSGDKGKTFHVHTESEYCGACPLPGCCYPNIVFGMCTMISQDTTA